MTGRRQPTIEWQVAGACNYDCSYCIQSRRYRRGRPDEASLRRALEQLCALDGSWEIKCSGGEAFAHSLFVELVVPRLMEASGHCISVLTNFSSSSRELMRFAAITRGRLEVFSASLHLEHVDAEAFADKAEWFVDLLEPSANFVVNQVVLPGAEDEALRCKQLVEARGLRWFAQLYKRDGYVVDYPAPDRLLPLLGQQPAPGKANVAPSYEGQMCWAGVEYFVIDKDGDAWACRTAKRHGEGHLGNVFDSAVSTFPRPAPCPYDVCPCTVPANRGMIEGVGPMRRSA